MSEDQWYAELERLRQIKTPTCNSESSEEDMAICSTSGDESDAEMADLCRLPQELPCAGSKQWRIDELFSRQ